MKLIKTTVHASRIADVRDAVTGLNIVDLTVAELREPARAGGATAARFAPLPAQAVIEIVVRDEMVADVIQAITHAARADAIGDGHVSVFPLEQEGYLLPRERDSG